jgi:hypothetical protein
VGWQTVAVNLEEEDREEEHPDNGGVPDDLPRLERRVREKLYAAAAGAWPGCETLIVRVRLVGRTPLDSDLRRFSVRAELCDLLREGWEGSGTRLWLKDLEVETRSVFDRQVAARREDLLGEVLRRADLWKADDALLAAGVGEALEDLFGRGRSRRILEEPRGQALLDLLEEAERLCADYLENN